MVVERCAGCLCVPAECNTKFQCLVCNEEKCCADVHAGRKRKSSRVKTAERFLFHSREMFAVALGIEVLCIASAELGQNAGLYLFGVNYAGIAVSYVMGYALAGVTTFLTILGRNCGSGKTLCGCCSVLENSQGKGFVPSMAGTLRDFAAGVRKLSSVRSEPELGSILKTSAVILVTAESACILVAETVGLAFYQQSILLSVPLALLAGAFAIVAPQAYRKATIASARS
ncbi:hypothetical protein [Nitrososphaera viennensis]|uniref:Uncharacterized protein n=1 Tax=Nitrososphaera viennensis TaxID=1034015 RepID=A0A977ICI6_9ARCH|nr:hypothetical protein [Nitrososphaera viennensis]UVS68295.1 hypothetical protein NWT39_10340 [Nitrososphaera viennensis]